MQGIGAHIPYSGGFKKAGQRLSGHQTRQKIVFEQVGYYFKVEEIYEM